MWRAAGGSAGSADGCGRRAAHLAGCAACGAALLRPPPSADPGLVGAPATEHCVPGRVLTVTLASRPPSLRLLQWQREKERNPSNHRPKQYFRHLYGEEDGCKAEAEPAEPAVPKAQQAQQQEDALQDAVPRGATRPPPPASPALQRDTPQACSSSSLAGVAPPALASPAFRSRRCRSPHGELGGSSGALHRMDDLSSHSPHSSFGDLASENSEPSLRR